MRREGQKNERRRPEKEEEEAEEEREDNWSNLAHNDVERSADNYAAPAYVRLACSKLLIV